MPDRVARPLVTALALLAAVAVRPPASRAGEEAEGATARICAADLRLHLDALACEAMRGRETTSAEAREAAAYVARHFERAGLVPHGKDGGWYQDYAIPVPVLEEGNLLEATTPDGPVALALETDWNPFSVSPRAEASGDLVFAGFGITAPERGHDDYAGIDAKGKVVLVLRKNPGWEETEHAAFLRKLSNAVDHGAVALLLCNDPRTTAGGTDVIGHWSGHVGAPTGSGRIPYAFVTQAAAARLLAPLGTTLEALDAEIRAKGPRSAAVEGVSVRVKTALGRTKEQNARNVVGFLPGREPEMADEVVVLGAHYDHVGLGRYGSNGGASSAGQVHNGADDNASGTAVLLEVAAALGRPENRPRRSVLFVAFSGEELGLLGSDHYVKHPSVPLDDVVTMVNLDMVGRCREGRLQVGGVGTGTSLKAVVETANSSRGFRITWDEQGVAPTDSTSFFLRRVPVLWFFTGLHDDYHRPSDDCDRIDYESTERVGLLVRDVVFALAERDERVTYTEPPPMPRPPILGVRPGSEQDPRGVPIAGVTPGGPAASAGMKDGDVVVSVAGKPVRNVPDLTHVLSGLEPGKTVEVRVLRGDEELRLDVTLGERPGRARRP
jgi:hypothetical protein